MSILDSIIGCRCTNEEGEVFTVTGHRMLANIPMWIYIGITSETGTLYWVSLDRYHQMIQIA
jgi:hypothetical protein